MAIASLGNATARFRPAVRMLARYNAEIRHQLWCTGKSSQTANFGVAVLYAQMKTMRPDYPVALLCRVF